MSLDNKLKPCPFCNSEVEISQAEDGTCYIECPYCHIRALNWKEKGPLIMFWNSRAIPENLILERWKDAEGYLLEALKKVAFEVTRRKEYASM